MVKIDLRVGGIVADGDAMPQPKLDRIIQNIERSRRRGGVAWKIDMHQPYFAEILFLESGKIGKKTILFPQGIATRDPPAKMVPP